MGIMFLNLLFSYLPYVVVLIALMISAYTDLKTREVSNYLTFGLMVFGILFWVAKSLYIGKFIYLPFLVGLITFIVCYLLWYISVFAGGDAKLIAGIAFCIPIQDYSILFANTNNPYFLPLIFILTVFLVFPLGFFLTFKRVISTKYYKIMLTELLKSIPKYFEVALTLVGLYFIFSLFGVPTIFALLSFLLWKITWKIRLPMALIVFAVAICLHPTDLLNFVIYFLISVVFFIIIKFFWFVRSKEFADFKKISELRDGDILYESLYIKDNVIAKKPGFKDIFKYLKNKDILQKNLDLMRDSSYDYVIKSQPGGLLVEEIKLLKALKTKKIIPDGIYIKQSVPLTPAILGGYIILLFFGGLI